MAIKHKSAKKSVGIRELKDQASEVIGFVQRTRRSVVITNKDKEVAKIIPLETDVLSRLEDLGLISRRHALRTPWNALELLSISKTANAILESLREERDSE